MRDPRHSTKLILCLGTVYLVWGSAFVFTKIAVANLPPALFAAVRFVTAGVMLTLIACLYGGDKLPARLIEWRHVIIAGFFMVFVSNGLNTWAMQYMPSNQSALLNGTSAFWIAGLGVFGRRGHPLTRSAVLGLLIGFIGAVLMLLPKGPLSSKGLLPQLAVLAACASWSLGTLYYRSIDTRLNSMLFMALQMFMGGLMLLGVAAAHGDSVPWPPSAPGLIAMGYLTFFSSCLAYTAYGWLSLNTRPAVISTYSYVNPAIAAFLGWLFLHENLSGVQLVGMVVIIVGVCILTLPGGSLTDPKTLAEPKTQ
ncbi:MAG TPA: EamA family transporter [Steroidobacteraceae bacterium]|nr:EamA family transporter [Steroidobacteraceae bacterium]